MEEMFVKRPEKTKDERRWTMDDGRWTKDELQTSLNSLFVIAVVINMFHLAQILKVPRWLSR